MNSQDVIIDGEGNIHHTSEVVSNENVVLQALFHDVTTWFATNQKNGYAMSGRGLSTRCPLRNTLFYFDFSKPVYIEKSMLRIGSLNQESANEHIDRITISNSFGIGPDTRYEDFLLVRDRQTFAVSVFYRAGSYDEWQSVDRAPLQGITAAFHLVMNRLDEHTNV